MPSLIVALAVALLSTAVRAHGVDDHGEQARWTFDPWVVVPLGLIATSYALGFLRLWWRAVHGKRLLSVIVFGAGWLALAGALVSPLHWLGEHLFVFHMIEHEIVMAIAAPLLVLARPAGVLLWSLLQGLRQIIGAAMRHSSVQQVWRGLAHPTTATLLHGAVIWVWHAPSLFDAAVTHEVVHRIQHLSFFLSALLFWWALIRRASAGVAVWHLFVTMSHTGILGALMALAPTVLYQAQTAQASAWGLTPLEDQQLAGLVMWIPAGTIYAGAALGFASVWISRASGQGDENVLSR